MSDAAPGAAPAAMQQKKQQDAGHQAPPMDEKNRNAGAGSTRGVLVIVT
jgi:hypothetical protein